MASSRASAQPPMTDTDEQKRAAAEVAALLVKDGDRVGLGTGSTVAHLLPALAARGLSLRCAATSPATERAARELGLVVEDLDELGSLDIAIDGADQIDPDGWLVKGGGAAHTHEKIVAAASERFVVIASAEKAVAELRPPVPLEILRFGARATLSLIGRGETARGPPQSREQPDCRLPRSDRGSAHVGGALGRYPRGRRPWPVRAGDGQRHPDRRTSDGVEHRQLRKADEHERAIPAQQRRTSRSWRS